MSSISMEQLNLPQVHVKTGVCIRSRHLRECMPSGLVVLVSIPCAASSIRLAVSIIIRTELTDWHNHQERCADHQTFQFSLEHFTVRARSDAIRQSEVIHIELKCRDGVRCELHAPFRYKKRKTINRKATAQRL